KLLFLHLKDDEPGYFLELINLSTGASEPVSLVEGSEWIPSYNFSPDGQMIVFESNLQLANNSETNGSVNNGHYLYQANSDGSNISQLDNAQEIVRSCWH
ncbi:MAG: hypothetical protein GWN62_03990, partial [Aliifodinibius sp.]|nr:hypothetical protein [Fodinibius sp.]